MAETESDTPECNLLANADDMPYVPLSVLFRGMLLILYHMCVCCVFVRGDLNSSGQQLIEAGFSLSQAPPAGLARSFRCQIRVDGVGNRRRARGRRSPATRRRQNSVPMVGARFAAAAPTDRESGCPQEARRKDQRVG